MPDLLPYNTGYLLTDTAQALYDHAPYPNYGYAAIGALAYFSGIFGRGWSINGAGLNGYYIVVGETGTGKELIENGISWLNKQLDGKASNFVGPSEAASAPALVKFLQDRPCCLSRRGEIGFVLQQMGNAKASPHMRGIERLELLLYSKSGDGGTLEPHVYSDKEKNTVALDRPSYSFIGDTTPDGFYANLTPEKIASGWQPRCDVHEDFSSRPPMNETPLKKASHSLLSRLSDALAVASDSARKDAQPVGMTDEAAAILKAFGTFATDEINKGDDVTRHLWNRAHLKAMKLAALSAVTRNMFMPTIDAIEAQWACDAIYSRTMHLVGKFDRNETGSVDGDEAKQRAAVLRIVAEYLARDYASLARYDVVEEMHRKSVVTHSYLSRRLFTLPAFSNDRLGPTAALKRVIQRLLDDDELREVSQKQMTEQFGSKSKAYVMSNMKPFLAAYKS